MALTRINGNLISSGTITGNLFLSNTITGNLIAPAAVTGDKIGLAAITGNLIAANAITTAAIADGSINTSELATGAVTGDKIGLTAIRGNLIASATITGDKIGLTAITSNLIASGVTLTSPVIASANLTTALTLNGAAGTNGQVLTSAGSGLPTWATPGGGSWQHITTVTASNSATVDVENAMTAYKMYVIVFTGVLGVSIDQTLECRLKLSGTYATSGYASRLVNSQTNSTTFAADVGGAGSILLADFVRVDYADGCTSGLLYLPNPSLNTVKTVFSIGNGSYRRQADTLGTGGSAATLTGVRFFMGSGNIASGTFSLYGISNT
jgi:hypothetical protein